MGVKEIILLSIILIKEYEGEFSGQDASVCMGLMEKETRAYNIFGFRGIT